MYPQRNAAPTRPCTRLWLSAHGRLMGLVGADFEGQALTWTDGDHPNIFAIGMTATLMQMRSMLHTSMTSPVGMTTRQK